MQILRLTETKCVLLVSGSCWCQWDLMLKPWYPWAGAAVWSTGIRSASLTSWYLCVTSECNTLPVCCRASKKLNMTLGSVMCFSGNLCKGASFLTSSAAFSVTEQRSSVSHSLWLQSQNQLFNAVYFNEERRSGETGGCTPAEVGGGGDGGQHSVLQVPPDHSSGSTHLSGCSLKLFFAEAGSQRKQ